MNGNLDEYLNNIEDFLEIENKIVTYKWISKALKVHTNTAKQLLYAFSKRPESNDKLLVTYLVVGEKKNEVGTACQLVNQEHLETTKTKFKQISSIHVFSIQKGQTANEADLYNAENTYKLNDGDIRFSSIHPNEDIKRRETNGIGIKSDVPSSKINSQVLKEPAKKNPILNSALPSENNAKDVKEQAKKNPINNSTSPSKNNAQKAAPSKENNAIAGLFKKQGEKKKEKPLPADKSQGTTSNDVETKHKTPAKVLQPRNDDKKKPQREMKRKKPKDSVDSASKKMKRIKMASDSESSDQGSDGDERYPSPEPEPEPEPEPVNIDDNASEEEIIPLTPMEKRRKRVRKIVDRNYADEDGFICTKKEYVMESCSDDEKSEVPDKKIEPTSKVEKKTVSENGSTKGAKSTEGDKLEKPTKESGSAKPLVTKGAKPMKGKTAANTSKQRSITSFFKTQQS